MKLIVNGETKESPGGTTVFDLIQEVGLGGRAVAVEVNRQIVTKADQQATVLNAGDEVELVTLVGGG
jgi:sulfur carrier protein